MIDAMIMVSCGADESAGGEGQICSCNGTGWSYRHLRDLCEAGLVVRLPQPGPPID